MKINIFKKGFNYSQDGPGNRLIYHLQGCNMACRWCSNPESMPIDNTNSYDIDDLVLEAEKALPMFFSGGGVTLTGGEPTVQFEAVREFYLKLKSRDINTAIETNGTHPNLSALFPLIDYLIMDFKHHNSDKLKEYTGVSNKTIIDNLSKIGNKWALIRIPLINNFNADSSDAEEFAKLFGKYNTENLNFEFLPYHEYGKVKWESNNLEYKMEDAYITADTLALFEQIFHYHGLKTINT